MTDLIFKQLKEFLIEYLENKELPYEVKHPWRRSSEYIVLHSLRVFSMAMEIAEWEKDRLSDNDITLIGASAILHDIGKVEIKEGHAFKSTEIVNRWLNENPGIALGIADKEKLLSIIQKHSDKDIPEMDLCSAILKDADILDEIGVLSIFMTSNHLDRNSPYFFNELQERIKTFELNFCDKEMNKLNTIYAKTILLKKMDFVKAFIKQLDFELKGTTEIFKERQEF